MKMRMKTLTSRLAEAMEEQAQKAFTAVATIGKQVDPKTLERDRRVKKAWLKGNKLYVTVHDAGGWGAIYIESLVENVTGMKLDFQPV